MIKAIPWGLTWLVLVLLVCPPVMADIIQPARTDRDEASSSENFKSDLGSLARLQPQEKRYFSGLPDRLQIVTGTFEEGFWGTVMLTSGIVAGAFAIHQLSK